MCSVEMMFWLQMPYGTGGEDTGNYNNNIICASCAILTTLTVWLLHLTVSAVMAFFMFSYARIVVKLFGVAE